VDAFRERLQFQSIAIKDRVRHGAYLHKNPKELGLGGTQGKPR
jgi:hypothetical protein